MAPNISDHARHKYRHHKFPRIQYLLRQSIRSLHFWLKIWSARPCQGTRVHFVEFLRFWWNLIIDEILLQMVSPSKDFWFRSQFWCAVRNFLGTWLVETDLLFSDATWCEALYSGIGSRCARRGKSRGRPGCIFWMWLLIFMFSKLKSDCWRVSGAQHFRWSPT